jgi:type II secretory pathway component PulF
MTNPPPPVSYHSPQRRGLSRKVFLQYFGLNLVIACCGVVFLLVPVPRFAAFYRNFGTSVPALTRMVLSLDDLIVHHYGWIPLTLFACLWPALPALGYAATQPNTGPRRLVSWSLVLLYLGITACFFVAILVPIFKMQASV